MAAIYRGCRPDTVKYSGGGERLWRLLGEHTGLLRQHEDPIALSKVQLAVPDARDLGFNELTVLGAVQLQPHHRPERANVTPHRLDREAAVGPAFQLDLVWAHVRHGCLIVRLGPLGRFQLARPDAHAAAVE